jgi:hypothetical protein
VLTIEIIGRKWIQIQGFLVTSLFRKSCVSWPSQILTISSTWQLVYSLESSIP